MTEIGYCKLMLVVFIAIGVFSLWNNKNHPSKIWKIFFFLGAIGTIICTLDVLL